MIGRFSLGLALLASAFVSCSPVSPLAYISNLYKKAILVVLVFPDRESFELFRSIEIDLYDNALEEYRKDKPEVRLSEASLTISFEIPASAAAEISGVVPTRSYSLRRECIPEVLENLPKPGEHREDNLRDCSGVLLYSLSSLRVVTPDGTITLTDMQIPMAFRRRDPLHYVFALNPDIPEFKDSRPKACCIL
jgi:hypothetical protein